jgi:hypothetical protein
MGAIIDTSAEIQPSPIREVLPAPSHEPVRRTRDVRAPGLLERFLVAAVATVLLIRTYLTLTGFPQIGGHGLHIAHMLFGGLGMLVALLSTLSFIGPRVNVFAAIVGGIGFGAFIDELGKFITSDNNYFFRPTIALIYIIFVLLTIAALRLSADTHPTPRQRLAQAAEVVTGTVVEGYPESGRELALRLLAESDARNPLVPALRSGLEQIEPRPATPPGLVGRVALRVGGSYVRLIGQPWFMWFVLAIAAVAVAFSLGQVAVTLLTDPADQQVRPHLDSVSGLLVLVNLIAGVLLVTGLVALRHSRLHAFRWFRMAVLVSLLLAQPLAFYEQQWSALVGLAFNLVLLSALDFAITRERVLESSQERVRP